MIDLSDAAANSMSCALTSYSRVFLQAAQTNTHTQRCLASHTTSTAHIRHISAHSSLILAADLAVLIPWCLMHRSPILQWLPYTQCLH